MSERDETLYIDDRLEFIGKALNYAAGQSEATLRMDPMRYDAILRNLELIGEAATRVRPEVRALAPDVPWREIVGTRNRVAHGYLGISPDVVRSILRDDLPGLRPKLAALLQAIRGAAAQPP